MSDVVVSIIIEHMNSESDKFPTFHLPVVTVGSSGTVISLIKIGFCALKVSFLFCFLSSKRL